MDASPLVAAAPLAASPLLLAAVGDFFWVIVLIIAFIVWVYNQIKKANEDAAKKAQQPPTEAQAPPRRAQADAASSRQQPPVRGQQPPRKKKTTVRPAERPALSSAPSASDDPWEKPEPVASHVRRHLDTQGFEQRTGSLGQLSQLDTEVDDHVQQVFDHTVGSISDEGAATEAEERATAAPEMVTASAAGIAYVLSDPESLRNAIVLQEVLRRPEWE